MIEECEIQNLKFLTETLLKAAVPCLIGYQR